MRSWKVARFDSKGMFPFSWMHDYRLLDFFARVLRGANPRSRAETVSGIPVETNGVKPVFFNRKRRRDIVKRL